MCDIFSHPYGIAKIDLYLKFYLTGLKRNKLKDKKAPHKFNIFSEIQTLNVFQGHMT